MQPSKQWDGQYDLNGPSRLNRPGRNDYQDSSGSMRDQFMDRGRSSDRNMISLKGHTRPSQGMYPGGSSNPPGPGGDHGQTPPFRPANSSGLLNPTLGQVKPKGGEPISSNPLEKTANDCEIIVLAEGNQDYAEMIEKHLRDNRLKVDLMFPGTEVKLTTFIEKIEKNGTHFVVIIRQDNEAHRSLTVHVLNGPINSEEHRNMPLQSGLAFIKERHTKFKRKELSIIPDSVKKEMNFILQDRFLTDHEYQDVLRYIQSRWQKQREFEKQTEFNLGISRKEQLRNRICKLLGIPAVESSESQAQSFQPQRAAQVSYVDNTQVMNYGQPSQPSNVGGSTESREINLKSIS